MALPSGFRLGPYEILSLIGAGGMGEVYRARDPRLSRDVAVKVLPPRFSADRDRLQRFEREAQAAGSLNHPNILAIFDVGIHEGSAFLVTELLEGETLRAQLSGAPFSPRKAIACALQIAHGLEAAHARGIIHRDLKPENIFVTADNRVKILDFGLAKLGSESPAPEAGTHMPTQDKLTEPGLVLGTLGYMSPEQVRGKPVDARSDIFSFGAVLYEMVTGERAFQGETAADTMTSILTREPPDLSLSAVSASASLQRVVRHCIEKNPDRRFQSAHDLAFDLETVSGISGPPPASPAAGGPPAARPWRRIALFAAIALALLGAAAGLLALRRAGEAAGGIHSMAVLPFVNASGDPDADYLSDGITESLINELAQLPDLSVMSRNTAFRFKGRDADIEAVGRELRVQAVLTGRVVQRGQDLTISAELVDTSSNRHIWGDRYSRKMSELLAVQDEIARDISGKLKLQLTGESRAKLSRRSTENTEAYQLYLKGRYFWNQRGKYLAKSIPLFEQALEKDPGYALAYAGLADAYSLLGWYGYATTRESFPKAKAAAEKALSIDDTIAESHSSLGFIKFYYDWDVEGALREFDQALALDPSYAPGHYWRSSALICIGREEEAIEEDRRAVAMDPLSVFPNTHLGWMLLDADRYDEAGDQLRKSLDLNSGVAITHFLLGQVYALQRRFDDAVAEMNRAIEISDDSPWMKGMLGYIEAVAGRKDAARRILSELEGRSSREYVRSVAFALVHTGLGEKDRAMDWLEKAYEEHDVLVANIAQDPIFKSLRSEPRFVALVRRVGVAPPSAAR